MCLWVGFDQRDQCGLLKILQVQGFHHLGPIGMAKKIRKDVPIDKNTVTSSEFFKFGSAPCSRRSLAQSTVSQKCRGVSSSSSDKFGEAPFSSRYLARS